MLDPLSTLEYFEASMPNYRFVLVDMSLESIKTAVSNNEFAKAIIIEEPLKYKYIASHIAMNDYTEYAISEIIQEKYQYNQLYCEN